jgi:hypothetical protein
MGGRGLVIEVSAGPAIFPRPILSGLLNRAHDSVVNFGMRDGRCNGKPS